MRICSLIKIKPLTASYYFDCRVNQTGIYTVYPGVFMRVSKFGEKGVLCIIFFICVSDFFWQIKKFLISSNTGYYFCLLNTCILRCKNDLEIKRKLDRKLPDIRHMYLPIVPLI